MLEASFDRASLALWFHPAGTSPELELLLAGDTAFVWGLLMDPAFIRELTGRSVPFTPAHVRGWRRTLAQGPDGPEIRLAPEPGQSADGVLLLGLSPADRAALDRFEQTGVMMERRPIECHVGQRRVETTLYMRISDSPAYS